MTAAAARLVDAFSRTDTDLYFSSFALSASFVLHTADETVLTLADYREAWEGWLTEGWSVSDCRSTEQTVQILGSTAIFTHLVETTAGTPGEESTVHERETIVFSRHPEGLLAVHEHLSAAPGPSREAST
ncbi:nuclear transport factor 2 family protein [Microbacterium tumbae]